MKNYEYSPAHTVIKHFWIQLIEALFTCEVKNREKFSYCLSSRQPLGCTRQKILATALHTPKTKFASAITTTHIDGDNRKNGSLTIHFFNKI